MILRRGRARRARYRASRRARRAARSSKWRRAARPVSAPSPSRLFAASDWCWRRRDWRRCDRRASSNSPVFSRATIVFSKVGGSGFEAIGFDLFELLGHALLVGRREILVLDLVKGRVMEIEGAFLEQWVLGHVRGGWSGRRRFFRGLGGDGKQGSQEDSQERDRTEAARIGHFHSSLGSLHFVQVWRIGPLIYTGLLACHPEPEGWLRAAQASGEHGRLACSF